MRWWQRYAGVCASESSCRGDTPMPEFNYGRRGALYGDLLNAGAEIYEYQPTMIHCKVMVIDETRTSVGSANFDDRSFRLNDEANLNVFSADLAREQIRLIEQDMALSKRMVLRRWVKRAITRRFYERLALLLRSQL